MVGDDRALQPDGPEEADLGAECRDDLLGRGHAQRARDAGQGLRLHGIELMVAADHERDHAASGAVHDERLDALGRRDLEHRGEVGDGLGVRSRHLGHRRRRRGTRGSRRHGLGLLDVRGVVVAVGERDRVLARGGEHVELLRAGAADGTRVREHRTELQPHAGEDARVGVVHRLVAVIERRFIGVEAVGVLHDEFACAHHAEARADFVAELQLDLVEVHGQLAVALELAARDVGDDFLVGRAVHVATVVPILQAQQLRAELVPAAGLLPQLGRLDRRHQQLQRAGPVHLLADDSLDLAKHLEAHREPRVEPRGQASDQAGAQHQLVADHLGFGRKFLEVDDRVG